MIFSWNKPTKESEVNHGSKSMNSMKKEKESLPFVTTSSNRDILRNENKLKWEESKKKRKRQDILARKKKTGKEKIDNHKSRKRKERIK